MQTVVVFPHQLFESIATQFDAATTRIVLHEHPLYFTHYRFHTAKLFLHRASMQLWAKRLEDAGFTVDYYDYTKTFQQVLQSYRDTEVVLFDTNDYWLERDIADCAKDYAISLTTIDTPQFMLTRQQCVDFASSKKSLRMQSFYEKMRKDFDILVDSDGEPVGGKWSFDADNRKKYDGRVPLPPRYVFEYSDSEQSILDHARASILSDFPDNPGDLCTDEFPLTHNAARAQLHSFLHHRLEHFGIYEDAMISGESELFHSKLSAALNCGLLEPLLVVKEIISYADSHSEIAINSLEGCIRQIIGWREYMRLIYLTRSREIYAALAQSKANYRTLKSSWYDGTTGIVPVDDVITRMLKTGYSHHIERLMVIGNMFQLLSVDPREVYEWFMMHYIDAYDWVMLGNVYAMSQYVTQTTTTKPYVSGSRYVLSMSNYQKGPWCDLWDGLYWNYIADHYGESLRNPRMAMMARMYDKLGPEKQQQHIAHTKKAIDTLTSKTRFHTKRYRSAIGRE